MLYFIVHIFAYFIIIVSFALISRFRVQEGKDERGQAIIAKSNEIAFNFVMFGFSFQAIYLSFGSPTVEHITLMISIWMTLVFSSNSISILVFERRV